MGLCFSCQIPKGLTLKSQSPCLPRSQEPLLQPREDTRAAVGRVEHASINHQEVERGRQFSEFQGSQGYTVIPCLTIDIDVVVVVVTMIMINTYKAWVIHVLEPATGRDL